MSILESTEGTGVISNRKAAILVPSLVVLAIVGTVAWWYLVSTTFFSGGSDTTLSQVSETLNVSVVDSGADYIVVQTDEGERLKCDYPRDFDGELYNCTNTFNFAG